MTTLDTQLAGPGKYGEVGDEYWAVRRKAGIANLSGLGRLTLTGGERSSFLNGLVTNDIAGLKEHHGIRACLLTTKARILADLHIYNEGQRLVLDTGESNSSGVKEILDRFIITEDVQVKDSRDETSLLTVQGPNAAVTIQEVLHADVAGLNRLMNKELGPSLLVNRDRTGQSGYDILLPKDEADAVWEGFLLKGVVPFGSEALNILRLEAGIPRYGVDMDENTLVLEAGLKDAISFSKGCYMGQETVARATFIGHVNRRLAQFTAQTSSIVNPKTKLYSGDREAGFVTSSASSPALQKTVGLGYVAKDFATEGTTLRLGEPTESNVATITRLA